MTRGWQIQGDDVTGGQLTKSWLAVTLWKATTEDSAGGKLRETVMKSSWSDHAECQACMILCLFPFYFLKSKLTVVVPH